MSDIKYVYPLIFNKVTSPHYVTPTLRRARLLDWLNENAHCRAVVIAADAGYGKTTLLWQWEREVDFPCYWYKLDRNDHDWSLHISYLIEAISQRHAGFGARAHSMLQQLGGPGSSRPGVAAYLLAEMHERLTEPCTFIIDDWQYVASVTEVRGLWNQILRDAPPTCRFVFLSRSKPQLQFARFKTHAGYAELRKDTLRFSDREIDQLFREIYGDPLDPTELVELERRTEGWAASLQLVEVSLRERKTPEERRAFIESITATSDSDIFAFLAEEVLEQQSEQVRNFLLSTSILQQINAELAERLAGVHEGARILSDLEQRGLFTYRLDPSEARYRYHGLFRDFLERRLTMERTEGEITGLHIHAASYFETHEQWPQAIHHYLRAGLQPQAARLIARYGEDLIEEGRLGLVDEWLQQLPAKTIRENARLSLLHGEACGIRGDWDNALVALERARSFFARKGDRRMEALACLKKSTVFNNWGRVPSAVEAAEEGLRLAPLDAYATRLRLTGNLAITSTWMDGSLLDVALACRRIAVEANTRGLQHLEAIALHNLGMVLRQIGELDESIRSLEHAARFWAALPANPFADNAELVISLLWTDQVPRAHSVAETAVARTIPWPRPHAEAIYGRAAIAAHEGRFEAAIEMLRNVLGQPEALGPTAELCSALLVECLFLRGDDPRFVAEVMESLESAATDPRQTCLMAPIRAVGLHATGRCSGECLAESSSIDEWDTRGAHMEASVAMLKLGAIALEHSTPEARALAYLSAERITNAGPLRNLRWWLRRFRPHAAWLAEQPNGHEALLKISESDPEGWRETLVELLPVLTGTKRGLVIGALGRHASKQVTRSLRDVPGQDVADLRKTLIGRQAPRIFIRSFGAIAVHTGSWKGPARIVSKRRTRSLLGLLVANLRSALTRDAVMDLLWPDADPGSAVNNLNQTVFQLRRELDPGYRDGESPQYILSSLDSVQLNTDLVSTDLEEFRHLSTTVKRLAQVQGKRRRVQSSSSAASSSRNFVMKTGWCVCKRPFTPRSEKPYSGLRPDASPLDRT
jgi:tetratricopeptide (TPR) repeat protein